MPEYSNYLESLDPVVGALSGDEIIGASKDGDAVSLTAQQIADLGGGGGTWGSITGTLSSQTDLQSALDAKQTAAQVQTIADAKVADAINNGTTTIAPSQNSVFDALALKTDQLTTFRRETAGYTLDSTDLASINAGDDLVVEINSASANDLTVPANATVAFPVGTKITGIQYGVGQTSIVAAGGVTIHTSSGDFLARAQYAPFLLEKVGTDEWYLSNGTTPGAVISSGTYTPALTNVTNVAASTAYLCQYLRVGATVTVSGRVDIDPTATGAVALGIGLPIPSNFSAIQNCAGVGFSSGIAGLGFAIRADTTNDRAEVSYVEAQTANNGFYFTFTYQII